MVYISESNLGGELPDATKLREGRISRRKEAVTRIRAMMYENGAADMEFPRAYEPGVTRLDIIVSVILNRLRRYHDTLARFWAWKIVLPVKMWWFFTINGESLAPNGTEDIEMLSESEYLDQFTRNYDDGWFED